VWVGALDNENMKFYKFHVSYIILRERERERGRERGRERERERERESSTITGKILADLNLCLIPITMGE
jgi:hypothetical protein